MKKVMEAYDFFIRACDQEENKGGEHMRRYFYNQWKDFRTFSFLPEFTWDKYCSRAHIDIAWLWWRIVISF